MATVTGTGSNPNEIGVFGESVQNQGVRGTSHAENHAGVTGTNDNQAAAAGPGVFGESLKGEGVRGVSHSNSNRGGVVGTCDNSAPGVFGESQKGTGVFGVSHGVSPAVTGQNDNPAGVGIFGKGGRFAGRFEGDIEVTGKIHCEGAVNTNGTVTCFDVSISNADCAEEFELPGPEMIEPGTLMSFRSDGSLCPSLGSYDNKVAGVISGAGEYKPGIVLDRQHGGNRVPIALLGKVFCKVDAEYSPIEVGDLLTTSPTSGHAMKATDHDKAFGSVIGKALRPQAKGRGMIPVLVALQ